MEDTVVLKQHYMYMYRLDQFAFPQLHETMTQQDCDPFKVEEEYMIKQFEKYNVVNWLGKLEVGEKTKKLHYQMVIWVEHKLSEKQKNAMRKHWSDRMGPGVCAIKSARKLASLASYSTKEDGALITNLSDEVLSRIPKWENKKAATLKWNDQLDQFINNGDLESESSEKFAIAIMEYYRENKRRPTRANMQYLMWRHNKIETVNLLIDWKLISNYHQYDEPQNYKI